MINHEISKILTKLSFYLSPLTLNSSVPISCNLVVKIFLFSFFIAVLGCGGNKSLVKLDSADQFKLAKDAFDREKYQDAVEEFKRVLFEHPGSSYVDDAQFYLSESYRLMEDYTEAISEYQFLTRNFPESPYIEDGQFQMGVAHYRLSPPYYLDQTDSQKAIQIFEEFLTKYPASKYISEVEKFLFLVQEKLARKDLENGRLYRKRKEYSSATLYFKSLLVEFPKSNYRREANFLLAECYEWMGMKAEALETYRELLVGEDGYVSKAKERIEKLEREG